MPTAPAPTCTVSPTPALSAAYRAGKSSYTDLAKAVGCSKALVGQIMAGQPTSLERAEAIAEHYGQPVSVLFRHKNGDMIGGA